MIFPRGNSKNTVLNVGSTRSSTYNRYKNTDVRTLPRWLHNYNISFAIFFLFLPSWCYCYLLPSWHDDSDDRIMMVIIYAWNTEAQKWKFFWANNLKFRAFLYLFCQALQCYVLRIEVLYLNYCFQAEPQNNLCFSSRSELAVEKKINSAIFFLMSNYIYLWLWVYYKKPYRVSNNWSFPL